MNKKQLKNAEWSILICTIFLIAIGLVALASTSKATELENFKKQLTWVIISIPILIITVIIDYRSIAKISIGFYIASIILLIAVLLTSAINGATSWFNLGPISIQPAEFSKIAVVLFLANIMSKISKNEMNKPLKLIMLLGIVAVPVLLIIMQPDYGTAMAFVVASVIMLYVAGINKKYIIISFLIVIIAIPLLYVFVLPEHAKLRIDVYLNPYLDPRGAGYNIIQSKLAVGSGQLWGMGLFNGNQTQLGILPMKTTDFIYPVISEEMGFIFSSLVIILFAMLLIRIISIAKTSKDSFGGLLCVGVFAMIFAHFVENIGMSMGLLPITGIPLPFISYGGSSMITNMIAMGLVMSVACRRKHNIFSDN